MKDFSFWEEYEATPEGSGRSEKIWLMNPDTGRSGQQYIVGQLTRNSCYEFRYCNEVKEATEDGFVPLLCFPDLNKKYKDEKLFSVFSSRLPDKKRKNIKDILKKYGLEDYDEYTLLKRSGARLPIDNSEF